MLKSKMPVTVVTGVTCLLLGVGIGVALMGYYDNWLVEKKVAASQGATPGGGPPPIPMPPGGGAPGGGPGATAPRSSSKGQLAQLVAKLDQLTKKPLAVTLTPEQKTKVKELLAGLDADVLKEDDARVKLDALLDMLEPQKDTMEAAGYRWPGSGGGGRPPSSAPNPFKEEATADHLKSLRSTVGG